MRAAELRTIPSRGLELTELPAPRASRGEAIVAVEICGICGTDLHILAGDSYRPELPFVLGHEPVGRVIEVGSGVDPELVGKRVTLTLFTGCGRCAWCRSGDERLCPDLISIVGVLGRNGAFAERIQVPAAQLVTVPEELPSAAAASLVDGGATAANAVRHAIASGARNVLILGGGGVGAIATELLSTMGREVHVVEPAEARRAELAARGHSVSASPEGVGPVDAAIDCAGVADTATIAPRLLQPRGVLVLAGYARAPDFPFEVVARGELHVIGVRSGARADLERVLRLTSEGRISLPPMSMWPLEGVNEALRMLRERQVEGKALVVVDASAANDASAR